MTTLDESMNRREMLETTEFDTELDITIPWKQIMMMRQLIDSTEIILTNGMTVYSEERMEELLWRAP